MMPCRTVRTLCSFLPCIQLEYSRQDYTISNSKEKASVRQPVVVGRVLRPAWFGSAEQAASFPMLGEKPYATHCDILIIQLVRFTTSGLIPRRQPTRSTRSRQARR